MASTVLSSALRRWLLVLIVTLTPLILFYNYGDIPRLPPPQTHQSHDIESSEPFSVSPQANGRHQSITGTRRAPHQMKPSTSSSALSSTTKPSAMLASPTPLKSQRSLVMVIARQKSEDVSWVPRELPNVENAIYTVDDKTAALNVPANKGHESMVYLTYIIDNYNNLCDITMFVHSHQLAYHNNDLLNSDMTKMVRRLNHAYVEEVGYFNLRCHHGPGCPNWIHTNATTERINRKEEIVFAKIWQGLHPGIFMPPVISVPCCSQFAASRDRLRTIPLSEWKRYREWLIKVDLNDELSGRVWEYTWHYILTGQAELCPSMHDCYCKGFHVCFPSRQRFEAWFALREGLRNLEKGLAVLQEKKEDTEEISKEIDTIRKTLDDEKHDAIRRGDKVKGD